MDLKPSSTSSSNRDDVRAVPPLAAASAVSSKHGNMDGVRVEGSGSPSTVTRVEQLTEARAIPVAVGHPVHNADAFAAYDIAAASGALEARVIGVIPNQQPAAASSESLLSEVAQFLGVGGVVAGVLGAAYELGAFPTTAAASSAAASITNPVATSHETTSIITGLHHLFFGKAAAAAAATVLTPPVGLLVGAALAVGYVAGNSADKMSAEEKKKLQNDTGKKFELSRKISKLESELKTELSKASGHDESVATINDSISKIQNSLTRLMLGAAPADDFDIEKIKADVTTAGSTIGNQALSGSLQKLFALHAEAEKMFTPVVS